jgi:isoleucyl-tRNA synthetase
MDLPSDPALVAAMDEARVTCSNALALRKANGLRVRLPLNRLEVLVADPAALQPFAQLVADEVNVREVALGPIEKAVEYGVVAKLTVNARAAGPRLGKQVQQAIKGSKSGEWEERPDGTVVSGGIELVEGEYELSTVVEGVDSGLATAALAGGGFVVLDTTVTPELAAEGIARDVIRLVQQARRDAGLHVSDRIRLTVAGDGPVWEALVTHQNLVVDETLAQQFGSSGSVAAVPAGTATLVGQVEGHEVRIVVQKAETI